ncbi:hypothetical protein [Streptomyces sp. NPDC015131]|uniref:hypothetical protein n=1 Tax=Streptomyces sp. NPDC015131 TaxID=3364941 RepID=UPI0036FF4426
MTSTTDMAQHPDVSEISDLTEGLLPPSRTVDVRAHLDDCALCADVRSSLEEIRGLLGTLPGPARMPADIAERIDAALAAEALLDATAPSEPVADVSRETSPASSSPEPVSGDRPDQQPDGRESQSEDRPRRQAPHGERHGTEPADRPAGRPRAASGPGHTRPPRRRRRVLGAVLGVAALSMGALLFQAVQPGDDPAGSRSSDTAVSAPSPTTFSGAAVEDQVDALLAQEKGPASPRAEKQPPSADNPATKFTHEAVTVPSCVLAGTGRSDQPLAAEPGTYAGKDAYLVVLPHASQSSQVQAYVLDASCVAQKTAKADVLLSRAYPRP